MSVTAFILAKNALRESLYEKLTITTEAKQAEVQRWFDTQRQDVVLLSQLPEIRRDTATLLAQENDNSEAQRAYEFLSAYFADLTQTKTDLKKISILTTGGVVVVSTDQASEQLYQPLGNTTTYFEPDQAQLNPTFYRSAITGKPTITLATPIFNQANQRVGVISVDLDLQRVDDFTRSSQYLGATGATYLIGRLEQENSFISLNANASADQATVQPNQPPISEGITLATNRQNGKGLYHNYKGQPVIGVYRWLDDQNLALLAEIHQTEAFAPARRLAGRIFWVGLLTAGCLQIVIYGFARRATRPLLDIRDAAEQMADGELTHKLPVLSEDEIGSLSRAFNKMATRLQASFSNLKATNAELARSLNEVKRIQIQLVQAEKMSALGNLVAGVAHEINNPLGFIAGNLNPVADYTRDVFTLLGMYQAKFPDPGRAIVAEAEAIDLDYIQEDLPQLLKSIKLGVNRIRDISTSLRIFSRADSVQKVRFNVHDGLDSTLLILTHRLKANPNRPAIKVIKDYSQLPEILCFPGQLNQVFMNILANAVDALEDSNQGKTFQDLEHSPNQIFIETSLIAAETTADERICITIRDNGVGMLERVKQRIFDHLFTTKGVGQGTGLGLAIAHQIITDKHSGTIKVNSKPQQGTEFVIVLPVAETASPSDNANPETRSRPKLDPCTTANPHPTKS
ncbi:MAG: ATP-binding protein [Cyanobacteria bacterium J06635_15]